MQSYLSNVAAIAQHIQQWNAYFDEGWSEGLTASDQAMMLQVLGNRTAVACSSTAQVMEVSPEAAGFDLLLREAARVTHTWAGTAVDELKCCGNAVSSATETGWMTTFSLTEELGEERDRLVELYEINELQPGVLIDEVSGVEMAAGPGWLIAADGLSPVLHGPFDLNSPGLEGLGPDRWGLGTAVRVRRLRNPEPIDAAMASERFTALITQQGEVVTSNEVITDGVAGLHHSLSPELDGWQAEVTVFVAGGFTYFVETGCPEEVAGACSTVRSIANSLTLTNRD